MPEETYKNTIMADKIKYETAIKNNMSYFIINASDPENLFESAKSILSFINFSSVSEIECEKFANYKSIKDECNLWNHGYTLDEIHIQLNKPIQSIQHKLRLGNKYGVCKYDKNINMHFHKVTNPNNK